MTATRPDFRSDDIAHRTHGYLMLPDGRLVDSGDSDVSWKLAAGGWVSTITDFARFAAGIGSAELLADEKWERMWTPQDPSNAQPSNYGYGFAVGTIAGERFVGHSGGQRKCSAYMICLPRRHLAVVIMCNTEGVPVVRLARAIIERLLSSSN